MAFYRRLFLLHITVPIIHAYICTTEVHTRTDGNLVTFVDCNPVFEKCCEEGCCPRFSHAHIWIFTAGISFIIGICIFGCWLTCCKNRGRNRSVPQSEDRVDSPLTLVLANARPVNNGNTNAVPVTPPPTYEEATSMR
ncbi:uncharacterized protein LOC135125047 isoform X2 [Zophobas morio]|uniref:uncharacterized protein LOC135125047 isoform X2 n=1 Tax=Zophobas morio TaxID=2755281 RepID=UPI00308391A0